MQAVHGRGSEKNLMDGPKNLSWIFLKSAAVPRMSTQDYHKNQALLRAFGNERGFP